MQKLNILHLPSEKTQLEMARIDLVDQEISGNKWYKLKYNFEEAREKVYSKILTFGGAYSNHIYATAAAAKRYDIKSIGIIRGEEVLPLNPTLKFAREQGMELHYISRTDYRKKEDPEFLKSLTERYGDFYHIPEGGTNIKAIQGVAELIDEVNRDYDYWVVPIGTGGTMAGIISGLKNKGKVLGISALKGATGLGKEVEGLLSGAGMNYNNFEILHDYHFGGYAKMTNELLEFILGFKRSTDILLDPVYTCKMMYGVYDLIDKRYFPHQSRILVLHTGGLQGWNGMKERNPHVQKLFSAD